MQQFLEPKKIAMEAGKRVGGQTEVTDYAKLGHLGTGLQPWVGASLVRSDVFCAEPIRNKLWAQEPNGRTFYNRSLFGSGLNILVGAATGGAILLAIRHGH